MDIRRFDPTSAAATPLRASAPLLLALSLLATPAHAQRFRDPQDGGFDMSRYLATAAGFLLVPSLITEPAIGYGGVLYAAFFHGSIEEWSRKNKGRFTPPSISTVGGFATENGTWGALAGHFGVWFNDRVRYLGAVGYASANLAVYPSILDNRQVDFNLKGLFLLQQAKFRVHGNFLAGARYVYAGTTVGFDRDSALPGILPSEIDIAIGGLSAVVEYDGRDNVLSPTRGTRVQFTASAYGPALGGDSTYQQLNALLHQYWQPSRRFGLGLRVDGTVNSDGAPFFAEPYLAMRGLPALQYQGRSVGLTEIELRFGLNPRWSLITFGGVGYTDNGQEQLLHSTETVGAGGVGFRYLIARQLGLLAGIDVAMGPDQPAIYIQVGTAWF